MKIIFINNTTTEISYDGIGNITSKSIYDYTTFAVLKNVTYRYGNDGKSGWNNLLTGVDLNGNGSFSSSETISYDAIGNPTSYLGNNLTWFGRKLTGYNSNITYTYDSDGYRASKIVNGQKTTYQYINDMLVYECRPDMEIFYLYDSYSKLTGIRLYYNNSETEYNYYVATNIQGDVVGIYRHTGELLASYEYDAWGNILSTTDANGNEITDTSHIAHINPFRYRGYYFDKETGLYYLASRYYNPQVGRFLNADGYVQTGQGMLDKNMFAYCMNNPINLVDYTGCDPVPSWASNIVNGTATEADYIKALSVDPSAWAGSAGNIVRKAVAIAEKNYTTDKFDKDVTQTVETVVNVATGSLGDDIAKNVMNSMGKTDRLYWIPYGHEIKSFANIKGYGLVSLVTTSYQLCWDFDQYGNDPKMLARSVAITTGFAFVSIAAGTMIATSGLGITTAVVVSVGFGYVISKAEDEARRTWLK